MHLLWYPRPHTKVDIGPVQEIHVKLVHIVHLAYTAPIRSPESLAVDGVIPPVVSNRPGDIQGCIHQRTTKQPIYASLIHTICDTIQPESLNVQTYVSYATTSIASSAMARGGMVNHTLEMSSRGHFLFNRDFLGCCRLDLVAW